MPPQRIFAIHQGLYMFYGYDSAKIAVVGCQLSVVGEKIFTMTTGLCLAASWIYV
jgi:hypothetical protein